MKNDEKTQYASRIKYSIEELQEAENSTFFNTSTPGQYSCGYIAGIENQWLVIEDT